jgi:hypothetical protein
MQKPIESEIDGDVDKWQSVRILEQLKRVIVQQTSLASTIFTVVRLMCAHYYVKALAVHMIILQH